VVTECIMINSERQAILGQNRTHLPEEEKRSRWRAIKGEFTFATSSSNSC